MASLKCFSNNLWAEGISGISHALHHCPSQAPGSGCRWEKWEEVTPGFDVGWFPFHHLQGDELGWLAPSDPVSQMTKYVKE